MSIAAQNSNQQLSWDLEQARAFHHGSNFIHIQPVLVIVESRPDMQEHRNAPGEAPFLESSDEMSADKMNYSRTLSAQSDPHRIPSPPAEFSQVETTILKENVKNWGTYLVGSRSQPR